MIGKRVWIIGASSGIGAALAGKLSEEGAQLALSARRGEELENVRQSLNGEGHITATLDVTDAASIEAAAKEILTKWTDIDIVIFNAGAYKPMMAEDFDLSTVHKIIDVNLKGAFNTLKAVLPVFQSQRFGHLVLVGSVAGYRGLPRAIGYSASKAGVISLAESLRAELADSNIKVQVVNPGFVKTPMTDGNDFKMPQMISAEKAAEYMVKGMKGNAFEIHFPKNFSIPLKIVCALPDPFFFMIMRALARKSRKFQQQ